MSSGCNSKNLKGEPEHDLHCLLVKILQEFEPPIVHIEELCTILAERYEYYSEMQTSTELTRTIKNVISDQDQSNQYKIILEDANCALHSIKNEVFSLYSTENEDRFKVEIKEEAIEDEVILENNSMDVMEYSSGQIVKTEYELIIYDEIFDNSSITETTAISHSNISQNSNNILEDASGYGRENNFQPLENGDSFIIKFESEISNEPLQSPMENYTGDYILF